MESLHLNKLILLLAAFVLIIPSIHATNVKYCKKISYPVKVSGVEISPNPITRGKPATFNISASTDDNLTGGKVEIDVKYFGWHVHSENHDLCEETPCPVAPGDFVLSHSQVLPGITPPGSYTLTMKILGGNGGELTCINFDFSIGWYAEDEAVADS
ncbi:hypothetical protein IFM89_000407 [Coptis chinensis]|uniref:MD-2-related lipid-recognition domain-containing protein n=1 Tax=Coptis chinensis TaxID=261450 RepID=A0A835HBL8_9MAGN|nr:hypothetical protein IFM89_000407 [Coptis chinensis]